LGCNYVRHGLICFRSSRRRLLGGQGRGGCRHEREWYAGWLDEVFTLRQMRHGFTAENRSVPSQWYEVTDHPTCGQFPVAVSKPRKNQAALTGSTYAVSGCFPANQSNLTSSVVQLAHSNLPQ
jgi:hypothetical protein